MDPGVPVGWGKARGLGHPRGHAVISAPPPGFVGFFLGLFLPHFLTKKKGGEEVNYSASFGVVFLEAILQRSV